MGVICAGDNAGSVAGGGEDVQTGGGQLRGSHGLRLTVDIELTDQLCAFGDVCHINIMICVMQGPALDLSTAGNQSGLAGGGAVCNGVAILAGLSFAECNGLGCVICATLQDDNDIAVCTQFCSLGLGGINGLQRCCLCGTVIGVIAVNGIDPQICIRICRSCEAQGRYNGQNHAQDQQKRYNTIELLHGVSSLSYFPRVYPSSIFRYIVSIAHKHRELQYYFLAKPPESLSFSLQKMLAERFGIYIIFPCSRFSAPIPPGFPLLACFRQNYPAVFCIIGAGF